MKITLRHVAYVAVFLLIGAFSYQSYRLSVKIDKLNSTNSALALAKQTLSHKQDSINLLAGQANQLKLKADSLGLLVIDLQKDKDILYNELADALAAIDSIPVEDNYIYLRDTAYKYAGALDYPFNASQVIAMRKTYTREDFLYKVNINQAVTITILRKQNSLQDSVIGNQYVQLVLYSDMIDSLKDIVSNQEADNKKLTKDIIKQKRAKYFFQGTTAVGVIVALISLL